MELKYIALTCLLFAVVYCTDETESEEDEDDESVGHVGKERRRHSEEMRAFLNDQFAELKDTIESVNSDKIDHITEVVEDIRRSQRYLMLCKEGVCSDHGVCALSEDEHSAVCHCNEGYAGEYCEITGPCNVARYIAEQLPSMPGMEYPNCAEDGSYAGMQYIGSQAYCVTSDNEEIHGYSVNRWETGDMNCQCARDEHEHQTSENAEQREFNCLSNGNYPQVACDAEHCWCQDWQGHPYGEPVPVGELKNTLEC